MVLECISDFCGVWRQSAIPIGVIAHAIYPSQRQNLLKLQGIKSQISTDVLLGVLIRIT